MEKEKKKMEEEKKKMEDKMEKMIELLSKNSKPNVVNILNNGNLNVL